VRKKGKKVELKNPGGETRKLGLTRCTGWGGKNGVRLNREGEKMTTLTGEEMKKKPQR